MNCGVIVYPVLHVLSFFARGICIGLGLPFNKICLKQRNANLNIDYNFRHQCVCLCPQGALLACMLVYLAVYILICLVQAGAAYTLVCATLSHQVQAYLNPWPPFSSPSRGKTSPQHLPRVISPLFSRIEGQW